MSAKPRCHECKHQRGYRSTAVLAKGTTNPKKAACGCACHLRKAVGA